MPIAQKSLRTRRVSARCAIRRTKGMYPNLRSETRGLDDL